MQALRALAIVGGIAAAVSGGFFFLEQHYAKQRDLDGTQGALAALRSEVDSLRQALAERSTEQRSKLSEAEQNTVTLQTAFDALKNELALNQAGLAQAHAALATLQEALQALNNSQLSKAEFTAALHELNAYASRYQPVDIALGPLPSGKPRDLSYPLPDSIPDSAREILIYAYVATHYVKGGVQNFRIFVKLPAEKEASFYLFALANTQQEWSFNSDNMWLPMPADRTLHLQANGENLFGKWESGVRILAYR